MTDDDVIIDRLDRLDNAMEALQDKFEALTLAINKNITSVAVLKTKNKMTATIASAVVSCAILIIGLGLEHFVFGGH